jgi:17beta-estradiol 17-dehydrogenase / very-long-chain 3-oxoacyl-CoA reductase
VFPKSPIDLWI